jgi:hypothetical protein
MPAVQHQTRLYAITRQVPSRSLGRPALYHPPHWHTHLLRGSRPSDLPIEQPIAFEMIVNLKTAKMLALTLPPLLLAQADEVIE